MSVRRLAPAEVQPKEFAFTAENLAWAKQQIAKYPEGRQASAVIPLLWRAQEQAGGWTPQKAIEYVADMLGMAYIRVLEVATFYTMFLLAPVGKKAHVQVCGTTPCMLRGSDEIMETVRQELAVGENEVTPDGRCSFVHFECLGSCDTAPMMMVDDSYHENLTPERVRRLLRELG